MQTALDGLVMICCCHLESSFRPAFSYWKQKSKIFSHVFLYSMWIFLHLVKSNFTVKPSFWNMSRNVSIFMKFLLTWFLGLLRFCQRSQNYSEAVGNVQICTTILMLWSTGNWSEVDIQITSVTETVKRCKLNIWNGFWSIRLWTGWTKGWTVIM